MHCVVAKLCIIFSGIVHNVSIDGAANPLSAGDKYTLTCNVTAEFAHSVKWLDSNNTDVNDDITMVTVSGGNTTSLLLHFDPIKTSHAGTYTCVSSISEPTSIKMATRNLQVRSKSFNSLSSPLSVLYCASSYI